MWQLGHADQYVQIHSGNNKMNFIVHTKQVAAAVEAWPRPSSASQISLFLTGRTYREAVDETERTDDSE